MDQVNVQTAMEQKNAEYVMGRALSFQVERYGKNTNRVRHVEELE